MKLMLRWKFAMAQIPDNVLPTVPLAWRVFHLGKQKFDSWNQKLRVFLKTLPRMNPKRCAIRPSLFTKASNTSSKPLDSQLYD